MPGDIRSMKHWKLSKMRTPERSAVIFQAKPCALTGRKKRQARSIEAQSIRDFLNARKASTMARRTGRYDSYGPVKARYCSEGAPEWRQRCHFCVERLTAGGLLHSE